MCNFGACHSMKELDNGNIGVCYSLVSHISSVVQELVQPDSMVTYVLPSASRFSPILVSLKSLS